MKICIFGAGAIGGMLAALLSKEGAEVSVIARGEQYKAIKENGISFVSKELNLDFNAKCKTFSNTMDAGQYDVIFATMKAHSASLSALEFSPLIKKSSVVIPAINGIPWWYFYKLKGRFENKKIESVDPENKQWNAIGPEKVLGCVVYPAAEIIKPGVIKHIESNRFILGEPNNTKSERALLISKILKNCGIKAPVSKNIRNDIWIKLLGNLSFNPISVITEGTLKQLAEDNNTRLIISKMMIEAINIAKKLGSSIKIDVESRIEGAKNVGDHKSSTLQDFQAGKPLEIDALTKAVIELGDIVNSKTPTLQIVYSLVKLRATLSNCYPRIG